MKRTAKTIFSTTVLAALLLIHSRNIQWWWSGTADPFWLQAQKCSYALLEQINNENRVAYIEEPVPDRSTNDSVTYFWGTRFFLAPTLLDSNPENFDRYRYVLFFLKDPENKKITEETAGKIVFTCGNYALLLRQP